MKVTFSILCYNYGRYLSQAIESCLIQKQDGIEMDVLVINDGSTDETAEVCRRYGDRIRVISEGNQGFPSSLSRAVRHATGDYVFLLDADDYHEPEKLKACRKYFDQGFLFIQNESRYIDEKGNLLHAGPIGGGSTSTLVVHRDSAMSLLPVENEMSFHALFMAGKGIKIPDILTSYRFHNSSMTDRKIAGKQNLYLAGVASNLADRLHRLAVGDPLPAWFADRLHGERLSAAFHAESHYNATEAALELGQTGAAWKHFFQMASQACIARTFQVFHLKILARVILGRPLAPGKTR